MRQRLLSEVAGRVKSKQDLWSAGNGRRAIWDSRPGSSEGEQQGTEHVRSLHEP